MAAPAPLSLSGTLPRVPWPPWKESCSPQATTLGRPVERPDRDTRTPKSPAVPAPAGRSFRSGTSCEHGDLHTFQMTPPRPQETPHAHPPGHAASASLAHGNHGDNKLIEATVVGTRLFQQQVTGTAIKKVPSFLGSGPARFPGRTHLWAGVAGLHLLPISGGVLNPQR